MDLTLFGLTPKESSFYNELLSRGPQTVRELERITGEQRTNCYAILKSLETYNLVVRDDLYAVLKFKANNPKFIRQLLVEKQSKLRSVNEYFTEMLPRISSLYRLTTEQQGVSYFTDIEGFRAVNEDMLAASGMVRSFISETIVREQPKLYETMITQYVAKRGKLGIRSQFIACTATARYLTNPHLKQPYVEVRVLDEDIFDGEITLYDNKIVLTSYKRGALQSLVLNNDALAQTFRAIFETCWAVAQVAGESSAGAS